MRITYDGVADAAYIYLSDKVGLPETRHVDQDINMDFDEHDRLVGIEILGASQRLNMSSLMPLVERIDRGWMKLKLELERRKMVDEPIQIDGERAGARVQDVGDDYVLLRDPLGDLKLVTERQVGVSRSDRLIEALRNIGSYTDDGTGIE